MSAAKPVRTSKASKEVLKRSQTLKKKKKVGKIFIIFVLILLFLAGVIYLLYARSLSINTIIVQGNNVLETDELSVAVKESIRGKYWYLFPRTSIFIYPRSEITSKLLNDFPRLATVEVGVNDWDSLIVDVDERSSDSVWCQNYSNLIDGLASPTSDLENCYFADSNGFIFAVAPYFSNSVFLRLSGFLPVQPIGKVILPKDSYQTITNFSRSLVTIFSKTNYTNFRLTNIRIIDKNNYEASIINTAQNNDEWSLFFDSDENAEKLAGNLYTTLASDSFKQDYEENQGGLESIDLRYNPKVFYKFK